MAEFQAIGDALIAGDVVDDRATLAALWAESFVETDIARIRRRLRASVY